MIFFVIIEAQKNIPLLSVWNSAEIIQSMEQMLMSDDKSHSDIPYLPLQME